jgi:hypothetical protein
MGRSAISTARTGLRYDANAVLEIWEVAGFVLSMGNIMEYMGEAGAKAKRDFSKSIRPEC